MLLKRLFENLNFRRQLVLVYVVGIIVLSGVTSFAIFSISNDRVRSELLEGGLTLTESFGEQSRLAILYGSPDNARDAINTTRAFPNVSSVGIYYPDGTSLIEGSIPVRLSESNILSVSSARQVLKIDEDEHSWTFLASLFS